MFTDVGLCYSSFVAVVVGGGGGTGKLYIESFSAIVKNTNYHMQNMAK